MEVSCDESKVKGAKHAPGPHADSSGAFKSKRALAEPSLLTVEGLEPHIAGVSEGTGDSGFYEDERVGTFESDCVAASLRNILPVATLICSYSYGELHF